MSAETARPSYLVPSAYGVAHLAVDAATVYTVFATVAVHRIEPMAAFALIMGYDLLAFASQVVWGALADKLRAPRGAAIVGVVLAGLGVAALGQSSSAAMVLAGVGNALFHIGAGALSLYTRPGRAAPAGLFVGPGAIGLFLGIWAGKGGAVAWPFVLGLTVALALMVAVRPPVIPYADESLDRSAPKRSVGLVIIGLLLFSVFVRALVGYAGAHALPKALEVSFALTLAAFAGKTFGGLISDRLGWIETSVVALLVSAPLIAFGGRELSLIVGGMFLFQMTMPVTLTAVVMVLPRKPAFAFGTTCVALIAGAIPTFYPATKAFYSPYAFLVLILLSAAVLYVALRMLLVPRSAKLVLHPEA